MGSGVPPRRPADPLASGRVNQKRRTRVAVLEATQGLLDEGKVPTVGEAADVALVGRSTAYRYFPTQESLILEASLGNVVDSLDETAEAEVSDTEDPVERVDRILRTLHGRITVHEAAFRAIIRLSLEKEARLDAAQGEVRLLQGRRLTWMRHALAPVRDRLPPEVYDDLVAGLAMVAGTEAFIALKDACHVDDAQERSRIIRWTARTMLRGALADGAVTASSSPATTSPDPGRR
jgi:AcrR family transcriptional regulator